MSGKATKSRMKTRQPVTIDQEEVLPDELFDMDALPDPPERFLRISKLADPNIYNMVLDYLRQGNYLQTACEASGISYDSAHNWMKRGEKGENKLFYQFYVDVNRAIAEGESSLVRKVMNASEKDWKAAMALLSRRHRSRWGENRNDSGGDKTNIGEYNDNRKVLAIQASDDPESRELIRKLMDRSSEELE